MSDPYSHVSGCGCPACVAIRRVRAETGNSSYDHRPGCSCANCRTVRDVADARDVLKWVKKQ